MVNTVCENNFATSNGGCAFFGENHVQIILRNNTVNNNTAMRGGGFYINRFCHDVVVTTCDMMNNVASEAGALYSLAPSIHILSSNMQHNYASNSYGAAYMQALNFVMIESSYIGSNSAATAVGGLSFDFCVNCTILNSVMEKNSAHDGHCGALEILQSQKVSVQNTSLISNYASGFGGGVCVEAYSDLVDFKESLFANNTAALAGGVFMITDTSYIAVDGSIFTNNSIIEAGVGSVMYISATSIRMSNNIFDGNKALTGAGTIYWLHSTMSEPEGLFDQNNTFADSNMADYGPFVATEARYMTLHDNQNVFDIVDYDQSAPPLTVYLVDYYEQVVTTDDDVSVSVQVTYPDSLDCYDSPGFISGSIYSIFVKGVAVFDSLEPVCAPNHTLSINVSASVGYVEDDVLVYYDFRPCVRGEYYADRICHSCENGTYSLADPGTEYELSELTSDVCESCPSEASHCYGDVIVLKRGYWRISSESDNIIHCPWHDESCVGGASAGSSSCGDKYHGPLCAICDPDHHFVSSTEKCEPCGDGTSFIQPFTVALIIIIIIFCGCGVWYFRRRRSGSGVAPANFDPDNLIAMLLVRCKIMDTSSSREESSEAVDKIKRRRRRLFEQCIVYITFYQILSALSFVLDEVDFPDVYTMLVSIVSVVNLNINASSLVSCSGSSQYDYVVQLVISTTYPLVFILLLWLCCQVHIRISKAETPREVKSCQSVYIAILLMFVFLILPSGELICIMFDILEVLQLFIVIMLCSVRCYFQYFFMS